MTDFKKLFATASVLAVFTLFASALSAGTLCAASAGSAFPPDAFRNSGKAVPEKLAEALAREAIPIIDRIFKDNDIPVRCLRVMKIREAGDGVYEAFALLEDDVKDKAIAKVKMELIEDFLSVSVDLDSLFPLNGNE